MNYVFSGVFAVEAALKLIVYGRRYFKDKWNVFDFFVLVLSIAALSLYSASVKLGSAITVIRAFRLQKILKKFQALKSLRLIIQTFIASLNPLASIGSLLVLILYVYAIVGVLLFGNVKRNGKLNDTINFESFPAAALTLFVIATGDDWTKIRDSCSKPRSLDFDCDDNPTYEKYVEAGYQTVGCGPGLTGFFYFNSYYLIMSLILLKLFVAVIC